MAQTRLRLMSFYGCVHKVCFDGKEGISLLDIDSEDTESEWKLFCPVVFVHHKSNSLHHVSSTLLGSADIVAAFPNLSRLATILMVLFVTTVTVERTFSTMKLRLCSRMGENTLEYTMHICIEGPDQLLADTLGAIVDCYKKNLRNRLAL